MQEKPEVSIVVNCFNGERFLNEALDSIFAQTFRDWEIIFWDNASSDKSVEIAESYGSQIHVFRSEITTSLGEARKLAVNEARGDWIAFLDTDDVWLSTNLETQMKSISGSDYILSYSGINEVDEELNLIRELLPKWDSGNQLEKQLLFFEIPLVTSIINRSRIIELEMNFDEEMQASEEYNLYIRLLARGKAHVEKSVQALYRVHNESLTYEKLDRWAIERRKTLCALKSLLPSIINRKAFLVASRQADYYQANALMHAQSYSRARTLLLNHVLNPLFFGLFCLSLFPTIWRYCHDPVIKKKLTRMLGLS